MRRFSALLLALALTAGFSFGLVLASPSAQAAPPITPSPAKPITNEKFTISGTLKTKVVRPVELQALASGIWTKIASGFETANGTSTIQLTATTAGAFSYRAVAPSWHGAASVASPTSFLTVKPSTVVTRDVHPISDTEAAAISSYDPSTGQIVFADAPASLAAVTAGTVDCWGANFFGALGDGSTTHRSTPVGVMGFS